MKSPERLSRVRNFLYSMPWAITKPALEGLIQTVEETVMDEEKLLKRLEAFHSRPIDSEAMESLLSGIQNRLTNDADKAWFAVAAQNLRRNHVVEGNPMRDEYANQSGVAVLRFVGPIMPRATAMSTSGATSLELQMQKFQHALANDSVLVIVMDFDTPGGSAMGLEEAALQIFKARGQGKPIIGLANSMCCSAGFYLMSQCDVCYATPAAMVGSIGVRMVMESDARQRANDGIDVEYAYVSGPLKGGVGPLTQAQRDELTAMGDTFFQNFKSAVARARPMMDVESAATGQVWIGKAAQDAGLVDGITTMEDLIQELSATQEVPQ